MGINDGRTITETVKEASSGGGLPTERARQYQQLLKEKKEAEAAGRKWMPPQSLSEARPDAKKGVLEGLWMGNAKAYQVGTVGGFDGTCLPKYLWM